MSDQNGAPAVGERSTGRFEGFDIDGFWDDHQHYATNYPTRGSSRR